MHEHVTSAADLYQLNRNLIFSKTHSCWIWNGVTDNGHPTFTLGDITLSPQIVYWELANDRTVSEGTVQTTCSNLCCNPSHVSVTGKISRTTYEKNRSVKMTDEEVETARQRYAEGNISIRKLASLYGVGQTYMFGIIHNTKRQNFNRVTSESSPDGQDHLDSVN